MVLFKLRIDNNIYLTQDMAQDLIADITRAAEEAKDHEIAYPVTLMADNVAESTDVVNSLNIWIQPR